MKQTESGLIRRAAAGDREAFDALLDERWERIFRIASRIVGEREEAQDVAQAACLRLWQSLSRFRPGEDLDGWIYRMVVNLSIDALRRRRARPDRDAVPPPTGHREPRDASPDPEQQALVRELEQALERLTRDLPPRQKAAFVLTRVEGLSAVEAAHALGVAPSTVRNHLFQVRALLARRLREDFPGWLAEPGEDER